MRTGASRCDRRCGVCRLPHNDLLRPHAVVLMQAALNVLNTDNEENGMLCLRITFDLHKAFRPSLEELVPPFMEFVKKARNPFLLSQDSLF